MKGDGYCGTDLERNWELGTAYGEYQPVCPPPAPGHPTHPPPTEVGCGQLCTCTKDETNLPHGKIDELRGGEEANFRHEQNDGKWKANSATRGRATRKEGQVRGGR